MAVIYIPQAREVFRFAQLEYSELIIPILTSGAAFFFFEVAKSFRRAGPMLS